MKSLIDYKQVREIIEKRRKEHVDDFSDYRYRYNNMSIDDVIYEAKAVKELDMLTDTIETLAPSMDELTKVHNAVIIVINTLRKSISSATTNADAAARVIIDYLGIDIEDIKKDIADEDEE